jgi:hypothetical protein
VTQESLFLTLTNGNVFADTFASFAAGILGVNLSYIDVTDLTLDPGTTITSQNQASITVRADFLVTPADSFSGSMVRLPAGAVELKATTLHRKPFLAPW